MPPAASQYVSEPLLQIDGTDAPPDLKKDILKIVVEESLHLPAMFTLVLHNNYIPADQNNKAWRHQKYLEIGKSVRIGFSNSTTLDTNFDDPKKGYVIEGEITAIDASFTEKSESHLMIRGYDLSHRLHRGRYSRSFQNMTDSDIVKRIAKESGLEAECGNMGEPREYVFQENQTNMEFLRELAARYGFELFIQDGTLYFSNPEKRGGELPLKWLRDISGFNVRVTSAQQVSEVEVRGWDYENKRAIIERASSEKLITDTKNGKGSKTADKFKVSRPKMMVVDHPVFKADEAKKIAQALCNELGGEFIYADAKMDGNGNPKVRPIPLSYSVTS